MDLEVQNREEVQQFLFKHAQEGGKVEAIKGKPPIAATYPDGEPIIRDINIGWTCNLEVVFIDYKLVEHK